MVKLNPQGSQFDDVHMVERGVLGCLMFVNGEEREEIFVPTYYDLTQACLRFDLDVDSIRDFIILAKEDVHTIIIDVPRYKANHPRVGQIAICRNCGKRIIFRTNFGLPVAHWSHLRERTEGDLTRYCDTSTVAEPEGVAK